ncbi:hypothetical protein VTK73DRAFT_5017 [Phialemonium thermophilum]|uniref:Uncharacterized protein n=1 Tax=Phialemonium thermophilum TaxID=223376 RepID=A0ABR3V4R8_9PEZI
MELPSSGKRLHSIRYVHLASTGISGQHGHRPCHLDDAEDKGTVEDGRAFVAWQWMRTESRFATNFTPLSSARSLSHPTQSGSDLPFVHQRRAGHWVNQSIRGESIAERSNGFLRRGAKTITIADRSGRRTSRAASRGQPTRLQKYLYIVITARRAVSGSALFCLYVVVVLFRSYASASRYQGCSLDPAALHLGCPSTELDLRVVSRRYCDLLLRQELPWKPRGWGVGRGKFPTALFFSLATCDIPNSNASNRRIRFPASTPTPAALSPSPFPKSHFSQTGTPIAQRTSSSSR